MPPAIEIPSEDEPEDEPQNEPEAEPELTTPKRSYRKRGKKCTIHFVYHSLLLLAAYMYFFFFTKISSLVLSQK